MSKATQVEYLGWDSEATHISRWIVKEDGKDVCVIRVFSFDANGVAKIDDNLSFWGLTDEQYAEVLQGCLEADSNFGSELNKLYGFKYGDVFPMAVSKIEFQDKVFTANLNA